MRRIVSIVSIFCVFAGAIYYFTKYKLTRPISAWELIPSTALFIYETHNLPKVLEKAKSESFAINLLKIPGIQKILTVNQWIDSLARRENWFMGNFADSHFKAAIFKTSSTEWKTLWIAETKKPIEKSILNDLFEKFAKNHSIYLNEYIYELPRSPSHSLFFWHVDNVVLFSESSLLIEESLRVYHKKGISFRTSYPELFNLTKLTEDEGNLYVSGMLPAAILSSFTDFSIREPWFKSMYLDVKIDSALSLSSGFSFTDSSSQLNNLSSNATVEMQINEVIPVNFGFLLHFAIPSDFVSYSAASSKSDLTEEKSSIERIKNNITEEVALSWQLLPGESNAMAILKITHGKTLWQNLENVAQIQSKKTGDTLWKETFNDIEILNIPLNNFPEKLHPNLKLTKFETSFVCLFRDYLLITRDFQLMKEVIQKISEENTWKKSLHKNKFFNNLVKSNTLGVYIHTPNVFDYLLSLMSNEGRAEVESNSQALLNIENLSIQFTKLENSYFTQLTADFEKASFQDKKSIEIKQALSFPSPLISKIHLVKTHNYPEYDIVLMDSSFKIHYINPSFEIEWSQNLEDEIIDEIKTMDYYKNGKLQMVFITKNQLHIIDRTGKYIPGFPVKLTNTSTIENFNILDYKGNKEYRFTFSDSDGKVSLTDKEGSFLPGWEAVNFGSTVVQPLRHYRIGNKDVFLIATKNGKIHLTNRQGKNYSSWPKDIGGRIGGEVYVRPGNNFNTSLISLISEKGEFIEVTFEGEIAKKEQLELTEKENTFQLVLDPTRKKFIIQKNLNTSLELLQSDFKKIGLRELPLTNDTNKVQYFTFENSNWYIHESKSSGFFHVVYKNGQSVTQLHIKGKMPVHIINSEKLQNITLFCISENYLQEIALK